MPRTKVNPKTCIGCGSCVVAYAEGYEIKGEIACSKKGANNMEKHEEAINSCPVDAISWNNDIS